MGDHYTGSFVFKVNSKQQIHYLDSVFAIQVTGRLYKKLKHYIITVVINTIKQKNIGLIRKWSGDGDSLLFPSTKFWRQMQNSVLKTDHYMHTIFIIMQIYMCSLHFKSIIALSFRSFAFNFPLIIIGSSTFSKADIVAKRFYAWKTNPNDAG